MISISSSTAALCPQSFASMGPCTECTHHAQHQPASTSTQRAPQLPFPLDMHYSHASSSRILTLDQVAPLLASNDVDDELADIDPAEAYAAASFWAQSDACINDGYAHKLTDAEWSRGLGDDIDYDDSRSDLGAPEMGKEEWDAPPPSYEDARRSLSLRRVAASSELSPNAGTLGLTCNASICTLPPVPLASTTQASPSSIAQVKPSTLARVLLGSTRAHTRAQRQAATRAQRLEELHDAWALLGINTRELLARGGEGALPPFFRHPPRCGLGEMMAQLPM